MTAATLPPNWKRHPAWNVKPPPWAPRRPASWYRKRNTADVVAAAERAAAADTTIAIPER